MVWYPRKKFHTTSPVHQVVEQARLERTERGVFGREELGLGLSRLLPSARVTIVGICGDRHILGCRSQFVGELLRIYAFALVINQILQVVGIATLLRLGQQDYRFGNEYPAA